MTRSKTFLSGLAALVVLSLSLGACCADGTCIKKPPCGPCEDPCNPCTWEKKEKKEEKKGEKAATPEKAK